MRNTPSASTPKLDPIKKSRRCLRVIEFFLF